MNGWENFAGQLVGMVIAGAAVYGGIRSDLKHMAQGIERAESSARRAHARIDALLDRRAVPRDSHAPPGD